MAVSKKEQLRVVRERISAAKGFRKHECLDELWRRMNDLYRGKHFPKGISDQDRIAINISFATINVIGPSVAVNYPKITVTPVSPDSSDEAEIVEAVVNYWWRHYDVLPEYQRAVKDFLIYGFGWLKTGYRFVEEEEEISDDEYQAEFEGAREAADQYAGENPELASELPTDDEIAASIPSTRKVIAHDAPFVERVSPHDVFVDPEATSMQDLKWIAQQVTKTRAELWASDYKRAAVRRAKADSRADEYTFAPERGFFDRGDDKDFERFTVWEYYDLTNGMMCVFADEGGDEFLVDPTPQPYKFGHPFIMLRNYDVPEQFYPMGELEALEPIQHELNMTRTAMFNDRKQFRRGFLIREDRFDPTGRAALLSDIDNRLVPVQGSGPLEDAIIPLPSQQPNPQLYQDSEVIQNDAIQVTGINEYMRGAMPEIRRTATEAAIIQDVANARAADKLARVERSIAEVGRRMVILAQQYMHTAQVARIVGRNGLPHHFEFEPDDIQGEFHFEVEGGSTQPLNETQRRQTAMQLLQTVAPFGDPQLGLINMREVLAYALRDGFGIKNPERFLGADPAAQMQLGMPDDQMQEALPPGLPEEGGVPDEAALAAALAAAGQQEPTVNGGPPGGYGAAAAAETGGGGLPPGIEAQLAGQIGLTL